MGHAWMAGPTRTAIISFAARSPTRMERIRLPADRVAI
jgi:hypothetical protein